MSESADKQNSLRQGDGVHRRRVRYRGKHPRRFEEKYKEQNSERYPDTIAKVVASGKTPAGTHRPIMVKEILEVLSPEPGQIGVDCTLGYGGHTAELLPRLRPGGKVIALDADPLQLPKTEKRLRSLGYGPEVLVLERCNFAGIAAIVSKYAPEGADLMLADLGVSSMQLDDPTRGFSFKAEGPLDMRMNPNRGFPASQWLARSKPAELVGLLKENDEPRAAILAEVLAGSQFPTTLSLARAIRKLIPGADAELATRRVFQALRIAVNDELGALNMLLKQVPDCLKPGGRVAVLTFHSGEDRRVKKAFEASLASGVYSQIAHEVIRPTAEERYMNPRSSPAKLRWAKKGMVKAP